MIRGLIFDCDGTLADTMPLHWLAWSTITKKYGLHFPEDRFYSLGGVPSRDILKMLSAEQNIPLDHLAVSLEKENAYLPLLPQVEPIHEIVSIARENHRQLPMAVASGGVKHIIEQVLVHLDILAYPAIYASLSTRLRYPFELKETKGIACHPGPSLARGIRSDIA